MKRPSLAARTPWLLCVCLKLFIVIEFDAHWGQKSHCCVSLRWDLLTESLTLRVAQTVVLDPKCVSGRVFSHQWVASLTWALWPWRDPLIVLKHSLVFWDAPPTSTFSLQLKSSAQCGRGLFPPMPLRFHLKPLPPGWGASGHWRGADGRPCLLLLHHHHLHPPLTPPRPLQSLNTPAELAAAPPDGKRQFQHQHHVLNSLIHKTQDFNCCPTLDNLQFISVCRKAGIKVGSESDLIAETKLLSLHHWNSRMMLVPVSLSRWSFLAEVVLKLSLNLQKHYWLLWLTGVLHM